MARTKRIRRCRNKMSSQIEVDGRPCNDNDFTEVTVAEGDRDSDDIIEGVKVVDINVNERNDITTDGQLKTLPEIISTRLGFEYDGAGSSCTKGSQSSSHDSSSEIEENDRNTKALDANEPTYKLEVFKKNAMIIFNQYNIRGYKKPRIGTKQDATRITKTFGRFGFKGETHLDLSKGEIFEELEKFSSMDFTDYGCVLVVVLTHGGDKGLLMAKDKPYCELDILNYFKHREKPKLFTKPVILIIQACRGYEDMKAVRVQLIRQCTKSVIDSIETNESEHYYLPVETDTLVLHSSFKGKPSHRDKNGSWFIQSLCDKIESLSTDHDLESIMVEVKRKVAINKTHFVKNKATGKYQYNKQMPVVTSALIRKLYLRKFGDKPPIIQQTATVNTEALQSTSCDSTNNMVSLPCQPSLPVFQRFQYMRNILLQYVKENDNDATATFLLHKSSFINKNCTHDDLEFMLVAMSFFVKDKFSNTKYNDFIYYYDQSL